MTNDNFCFYLQNRLIQTSQTGGQWYSDTSPFSIPWVKNGLLSCMQASFFSTCSILAMQHIFLKSLMKQSIQCFWISQRAKANTTTVAVTGNFPDNIARSFANANKAFLRCSFCTYFEGVNILSFLDPPQSTEHCDWLYGIFGHETSCTRYW